MLDIALKEWAVVCDLMLEGQLTLLLRKGGIHESGGPGVFELEHQRFLLFPSWLHQQPRMIKPAWRHRVRTFAQEPSQVTFEAVGEAAAIWRVPDRSSLDALDDLHCWTAEQLDMRWNYKPQNPLYLVAVRVHRLAEPRTINNTPEYGGCRSWVPLRPGDAVENAHAAPVLDDPAFAAVLKRCRQAMMPDCG